MIFANNEPDHVKILGLDDIQSFQTPEYLIDGLIFKDSVALLYGEPGSAKSLIGLSMCYAIAKGENWMNRICMQGKPLYIFGEGISGIKVRIDALQEEYGVANEIKFVPPVIDLYGSDDNKIIFEKLKALDYSPDFIVVDTLARTFGDGNESEPSHMNQFIKRIDQLKTAFSCTVLIIHHTGKDQSRGARGASTLNAAVDTSIFSKITNKNKGATKKIALSCDKQKEAERFSDIFLQIKKIQLEPNLSSAIVIEDNSKLTISLADLTNLTPSAVEVLKFFASHGKPTKSKMCIEKLKMPNTTYNEARKELLAFEFIEKFGHAKQTQYCITEDGIEFGFTSGILPNDFHGSDQSQLPTLPPPHGGSSDGSNNGNGLDAIIREAKIKPGS